MASMDFNTIVTEFLVLVNGLGAYQFVDATGMSLATSSGKLPACLITIGGGDSDDNYMTSKDFYTRFINCRVVSRTAAEVETLLDGLRDAVRADNQLGGACLWIKPRQLDHPVQWPPGTQQQTHERDQLFEIAYWRDA